MMVGTIRGAVDFAKMPFVGYFRELKPDVNMDTGLYVYIASLWNRVQQIDAFEKKILKIDWLPEEVIWFRKAGHSAEDVAVVFALNMSAETTMQRLRFEAFLDEWYNWQKKIRASVF